MPPVSFFHRGCASIAGNDILDQKAPRLVLALKRCNHFFEGLRITKLHKNIFLLKPLMIILDEITDNIRGLPKASGGNGLSASMRLKISS
jgi:hypothetical protein